MQPIRFEALAAHFQVCAAGVAMHTGPLFKYRYITAWVLRALSSAHAVLPALWCSWLPILTPQESMGLLNLEGLPEFLCARIKSRFVPQDAYLAYLHTLLHD